MENPDIRNQYKKRDLEIIRKALPNMLVMKRCGYWLHFHRIILQASVKYIIHSTGRFIETVQDLPE